ncbi:hypothetical protein ES703_94430 [subsurface metagenome]
MEGSPAGDNRFFYIEQLQVFKEGPAVVFSDLPGRLSLFPGTFDDLIFTLIRIIGQMAHIRNVHHMVHPVAEEL